MGNFLSSKWGSYVKAFIVIMLAFIASKGTVTGLDWSEVIISSLVSFLPFALRFVNEDSWLNTAYGSYLKMFLSVGIAYIIDRGGFVGINWDELINTCFMSVIPVVINILNAKDDRYGVLPPNTLTDTKK